MAAGITTVLTSAGEFSFSWGLNRWVLVDPAGVQRQVRSARELARLLAELGLPGQEAEQVAKAAWRGRPADAEFGEVREGEAAWKSTGLPVVGVGLVLAVLVVLVLIALTGR